MSGSLHSSGEGGEKAYTGVQMSEIISDSVESRKKIKQGSGVVGWSCFHREVRESF